MICLHCAPQTMYLVLGLGDSMGFWGLPRELQLLRSAVKILSEHLHIPRSWELLPSDKGSVAYLPAFALHIPCSS